MVHTGVGVGIHGSDLAGVSAGAGVTLTIMVMAGVIRTTAGAETTITTAMATTVTMQITPIHIIAAEEIITIIPGEIILTGQDRTRPEQEIIHILPVAHEIIPHHDLHPELVPKLRRLVKTTTLILPRVHLRQRTHIPLARAEREALVAEVMAVAVHAAAADDNH